MNEEVMNQVEPSLFQLTSILEVCNKSHIHVVACLVFLVFVFINKTTQHTTYIMIHRSTHMIDDQKFVYRYDFLTIQGSGQRR